MMPSYSLSLSAYTCAIEVLTAVPRRIESPSTALFTVQGFKYIGRCSYLTEAVGWERKPDSATPPRPAFFHCTVGSEDEEIQGLCNSLQSKPTNISILVNSTALGRNMVASFLTNPPLLRMSSHRRHTRGLGVCTNAIRKSYNSAKMLQTFANYYSGFLSSFWFCLLFFISLLACLLAYIFPLCHSTISPYNIRYYVYNYLYRHRI